MRTLIILVLLFLNFPALASNFNWKFSVDAVDEKSIGDDEKEVAVGDWICTIGSPKPDSAGSEMRRLGCGPKGGLQAYLLVVCYKDKNTGKPRTDGTGILNLQMKKSGSKMVALTCS